MRVVEGRPAHAVQRADRIARANLRHCPDEAAQQRSATVEPGIICGRVRFGVVRGHGHYQGRPPTRRAKLHQPGTP